MSVKEVVPRALARRDVEEAVDHYLEEAGGKAALDFIDEIERAFRHIAGRPAAGSPRYAHELDLPGLPDGSISRRSPSANARPASPMSSTVSLGTAACST